MGMGWTASENLICVFEDGSITVHSIFGHKVYNRRLDRVSEMIGVSRLVVMCVAYQALLIPLW